MVNKLKSMFDAMNVKSPAQLMAEELKAKDRIIREQELEIAKLRRENKLKTSPAQRASNQKWRDVHKEEHRAMMRDYMRRRRAAAKASKEKQPPLA